MNEGSYRQNLEERKERRAKVAIKVAVGWVCVYVYMCI
jgi:hypothetical protein